MGKIRIDVEKLRSSAGLLDERIIQLSELNGQFNTLLARIGDSWDGKASAAYIQVMGIYAGKADEMIQVLKAFKTYVNQAADRFESKDKEAALRIRSSF